jgi:hypothetical protein
VNIRGIRGVAVRGTVTSRNAAPVAVVGTATSRNAAPAAVGGMVTSRDIPPVAVGSAMLPRRITTRPAVAAVLITEGHGKGDTLSGGALRRAKSASPGCSNTSRICALRPKRWKNASPR